jgi:hypothetical protein
LGHLISIGRDRILGLGDRSLLSVDLTTHLKQKKIIVLAQVKNHMEHFSLTKNCLCSDDLGLAGEMAAEWDLYHWALIGVGATIRDSENKLMWT